MDDLDSLRSELIEAVAAAADPSGLESVRISALGKKGRITGLMKGLGAMDPESRREAGGCPPHW